MLARFNGQHAGDPDSVAMPGSNERQDQFVLSASSLNLHGAQLIGTLPNASTILQIGVPGG
jgi:hypothetical protein